MDKEREKEMGEGEGEGRRVNREACLYEGEIRKSIFFSLLSW